MSTRVHTTLTVQHDIDLYVNDCPTCGIVFGMPTEFEQRRREDHRQWYCPNGHTIVFLDKTGAEAAAEKACRDLERVRDQLAQTRSAEAEALAQAERERNAHRTTKGQLTKARNRAAAGMCSECRRTFQNMAAHMQTKHPGVVTELRQEREATHAAP